MLRPPFPPGELAPPPWGNRGSASEWVWNRETDADATHTLKIHAIHLLYEILHMITLRDPRGAPPPSPNSFISMQFSAKSLQNNRTYGSWRPLRKILDPPWIMVQ